MCQSTAFNHSFIDYTCNYLIHLHIFIFCVLSILSILIGKIKIDEMAVSAVFLQYSVFFARSKRTYIADYIGIKSITIYLKIIIITL